MQIYLPIAEISINLAVLLLVGGGVGFVSGLFGVGGGFLLTPLLIFLGIPAPIAVGSGVNQIVASSFTGAIVHTKKGNVDFAIGSLLFVGGLIGSSIGVVIFNYLKKLGQIDFIISFCYVFLLGFIGFFMFYESFSALLKRKKSKPTSKRKSLFRWLPYKVKFEKSGLYMSAFLPFLVGTFVGIVIAIMGISGILMIPAMIYILGMRTKIVVGTSLFIVACLTSYTTIIQAGFNHSVDIILSLTMIIAGVIGAQIGAKAGEFLKGEQLRILLSILVLIIFSKMVYTLFATPCCLYTVEMLK
jgi:uncharacterized membrane protein YfcA